MVSEKLIILLTETVTYVHFVQIFVSSRSLSVILLLCQNGRESLAHNWWARDGKTLNEERSTRFWPRYQDANGTKFLYILYYCSGCHAIVVIIFKYCMFGGNCYRAERRRMDFVNLIRIHCSPSRGTRGKLVCIDGVWSMVVSNTPSTDKSRIKSRIC